MFSGDFTRIGVNYRDLHHFHGIYREGRFFFATPPARRCIVAERVGLLLARLAVFTALAIENSQILLSDAIFGLSGNSDGQPLIAHPEGERMLAWIVRNTLVAVAFSVSGFAQCHAQQSIKAEPLWCPPVWEWPSPLWADPESVPNGFFIQVGSRVFHTCTGPKTLAPVGERVMRLIFNHNMVPDLVPDVIATLTVSDRLGRDDWLPLMLRNQVPTGTRIFGGVRYREYDTRGLEGDDRLYSSFFVYEAVLNPSALEMPAHAVTCPDKIRNVSGANACFVHVFYQDIRANIMVAGDGLGLRPIPRDSFPAIARDMNRVLRMGDVTESLRESQGTYRFVE